MTKTQNSDELGQAILDEIAALERDPRRIHIAEVKLNGYGKFIAWQMVQLKFAESRHTRPELNLPFLANAYKEPAVKESK